MEDQVIVQMCAMDLGVYVLTWSKWAASSAMSPAYSLALFLELFHGSNGHRLCFWTLCHYFTLTKNIFQLIILVPT